MIHRILSVASFQISSHVASRPGGIWEKRRMQDWSHSKHSCHWRNAASMTSGFVYLAYCLAR